jgi:hypothetical protein
LRQPDPGVAGKGGSSLDNAETRQDCQMARVRLARRRGVRVQKPVVEPPQEVRTGSNLVDLGRDSSAPRLPTTGRSDPVSALVDAGGHGESLRRSRGQACRGKAGHRSRRPVCGERGNHLRVAYLPASPAGSGKARGLLMTWGWGGGFVVVRGRESRSHGEGTQRVRNGGTGMSGGRW